MWSVWKQEKKIKRDCVPENPVRWVERNYEEEAVEDRFWDAERSLDTDLGLTGREELSSNVKEEKKQRLRATPFDQMHLRKKKVKKEEMEFNAWDSEAFRERNG